MYESWPQIHILEYFISSQVELEQFVGCWPVVEIIKQVLVNYRATENKKDGHAKTKRNVHTSFSSVIPLNRIVSADVVAERGKNQSYLSRSSSPIDMLSSLGPSSSSLALGQSAPSVPAVRTRRAHPQPVTHHSTSSAHPCDNTSASTSRDNAHSGPVSVSRHSALIPLTRRAPPSVVCRHPAPIPVSARPASNASSSMSPPPSPKPRNVPPGATTHTIPSDGEEESDTEIHGMYDSDFDRQTAIMNEIYRKEALEKERKGTLHYFKQSSQVYS